MRSPSRSSYVSGTARPKMAHSKGRAAASGNFCSRPERFTASVSDVPGGTCRSTLGCRSGSAYTTRMRSSSLLSINGASAVDESVDHLAAVLLERARQQHAEHGVRELETDREPDLHAFVAQRREDRKSVV